MIQQLFQMLKLQWVVFRVSAAKWRKGDEGVTTIEMVIIGGFLIGLAGALILAFNTIWTTDKGKIVAPTTEAT